jgi:hypothetical protein
MANPWQCPRCQRRVPSYATKCHCGQERPVGLAALPRRSVPRPGVKLTPELRMLVGVMVFLVITMVVLLFVPIKQHPVAPVLGYIDHAPTPAPRHHR